MSGSQQTITLNDVRLDFIKQIDHEPHSASQLLNFCKQRNISFKYKDINQWWPNRPKSKEWLQNSTNTAYQIHRSTNTFSTNKNQLQQQDEVFYDPQIKCYNGNAKVDKSKSQSYTLSDKDYVKYHKFQEKKDNNYKDKNKNTFYVENVKYSQNKSNKKKEKKKKKKTTVSAMNLRKKESKPQNQSVDDGSSLTLPSNSTWKKDSKINEVAENNPKMNVIGVNKVFDASHEYIDLLETIIYGYLRLISTKYNIFIPSDIKRLCYLWYHPNTIYLNVICPMVLNIKRNYNRNSTQMSIGIIPTETILDLKGKIKDMCDVEVKNQVLIQMYLGKTLLDKFHIADYNLHDNDVLQLKVSYR